MKCRRAVSLLPLLVEGDLPARDGRDVAAHVASCADCAKEARAFEESQRRLRSFPSPELDEAFHLEVRRAVNQRIDAQDRKRGGLAGLLAVLRFPAVAGAAALLLLSAIGLLVLPVRPRPGTVADGAVHHVPPPVRTANADAEVRSLPPPVPSAATPDQAPPEIAAREKPAPSGRALAARRPARKARPETALAESTSAVEPGEPIRIEIHTANPNVRIIWLAHRGDRAIAARAQGNG